MTTLNLKFTNGDTASVESNALYLVQAERHFGSDVVNHRIEATFYSAWLAQGSPSTFDEWLATVASFEEVAGDVGPTRPGPQPEGSPSSP